MTPNDNKEDGGMNVNECNPTIEQIKEMLAAPFDDALGEFTFVAGNRIYKRDGKGWLSKTLNGTGLTNKLQPNTQNAHNLSDLRTILAQHEEIERLKQANLKALELLDAAVCPCCDKSGAYYDTLHRAASVLLDQAKRGEITQAAIYDLENAL